MIGFAQGLQQGMSMYGQMEDMKNRREKLQWEREDRARKQAENQRIDQAWGNLERLQTEGVGEVAGYGSGPAAEQEIQGDYAREAARMGAPAPDKNLGITKRKAKKSELAEGMMGVAGARRDMAGYTAAYGMREGALDEETMAGVKLPDPNTPEWGQYADQLTRHLNTTSPVVTFGDPDAQGFRPMSVVQPDGKALFSRLSQAEQLQLAQAQALMERNPTKAMQMIAGVNKTLAEAIKIGNDDARQTGEAQNMNAYRQGALRHQEAERIDNQNYRNQMVGLRRQEVGIQGQRASLENAALIRIRQGEQLGNEAAGLAQGLARAQALGPEGKQAAAMYGEQLANVHQRMRALGINPGAVPGAREQMDPKTRADILIKAQDIADPVQRNQFLFQAGVIDKDPMAAFHDALADPGSPKPPNPNKPGRGVIPSPVVKGIGDGIKAGIDNGWLRDPRYGRPAKPEGGF